jgi:hypothetical protein
MYKPSGSGIRRIKRSVIHVDSGILEEALGVLLFFLHPLLIAANSAAINSETYAALQSSFAVIKWNDLVRNTNVEISLPNKTPPKKFCWGKDC